MHIMLLKQLHVSATVQIATSPSWTTTSSKITQRTSRGSCRGAKSINTMVIIIHLHLK